MSWLKEQIPQEVREPKPAPTADLSLMRCNRPDCWPAYVAQRGFVRCLGCGYAGATETTQERAKDAWNAEMTHRLGKA